jgi:hypothetical protein
MAKTAPKPASTSLSSAKAPGRPNSALKGDQWAVESVEWFERRLARAFPGVRGLQIYTSQSEMVRRLLRFFEQPHEEGQPPASVPYVWWFRGGKSSEISDVRSLPDDRVLIDSMEIRPSRLAVYRDSSPWYQLVYLEIHPDTPARSGDMLESAESEDDFAREEYALLNGQPISLEEHFDGTAEIEGAFVDARGSEYRARFLKPSNLLLVPQGTPLNDAHLDPDIHAWLHRLLRNPGDLQEFVDMFRSLPKILPF